MALIEIGGEPFNVVLDGPEGAPVLMLSNSLSSNLTMWDPQIPLWATRFRVLRYDSRGHGLSSAPDRPYSIAELGRDAIAILDALGIARAHWCGLSKGGMVGMWFATHARERLGRVVLANTAARMAPPDLWNARIRMVKASRDMTALIGPTTERWLSKGFREAGGPTVDSVRAMIATTPPQGYAGCCAAIRDMDQREALSGITNPVLVIVGSQDPATPPSAGRFIRDHIPGAALVELDAAHVSNLEQPEHFGRAVFDFLTA